MEQRKGKEKRDKTKEINMTEWNQAKYEALKVCSLTFDLSLAQHKCTALSNLLPSTVARRRLPLLAQTFIRRTKFAVTILPYRK